MIELLLVIAIIGITATFVLPRVRFDLVRVDQLVVSATRVDDARSVLRFDAVVDGARRSVRTATLGAAGAALLVLGVAAVPLLFLTMMPQVVVVIMALLAAIAGGVTWLCWRTMARTFRTMVGRAQQRIESLLDEAQHGRLQASPTLLEKMLQGPSPF